MGVLPPDFLIWIFTLTSWWKKSKEQIQDYWEQPLQPVTDLVNDQLLSTKAVHQAVDHEKLPYKKLTLKENMSDVVSFKSAIKEMKPSDSCVDNSEDVLFLRTDDNIYSACQAVNHVGLSQTWRCLELLWLGLPEQVWPALWVSPLTLLLRCHSCNPAAKPCGSVRKNEFRVVPLCPPTQSLKPPHADDRKRENISPVRWRLRVLWCWLWLKGHAAAGANYPANQQHDSLHPFHFLMLLYRQNHKQIVSTPFVDSGLPACQ